LRRQGGSIEATAHEHQIDLRQSQRSGMNSPRFLSFAIPGAIIVLAIVGNVVTSAVERSWVPGLQRGNVGLLIRLGVGLGVTLLALAATIYGFDDLT
jgi:hypothetical protein